MAVTERAIAENQQFGEGLELAPRDLSKGRRQTARLDAALQNFSTEPTARDPSVMMQREERVEKAHRRIQALEDKTEARVGAVQQECNDLLDFLTDRHALNAAAAQQPEGSCRICWMQGHYARDCPQRTEEDKAN